MLIGGKQFKEELEKTTKDISEQGKKIAEVHYELSDIKNELQSVHKQLKKIKEDSHDVVAELRKTLKETGKLNEKYSKKIYEISVFEKDVRKLVSDKIDNELKSEVLAYFDDFKAGLSSFHEMKDDVGKVIKRTEILSTEIDKFKEIASRIKKEDFQLVSYIRNIKAMEGEKIRLLKKIDSLERLCGRLSRK